MSPLYRSERIGDLTVEPAPSGPGTAGPYGVKLILPIGGPIGAKRGEGELDRQELEQLRDVIDEALS